MRHLLAFLAVLALLISPVTAAAAQERCAMASQDGMAGMAMPMAKPTSASKAQTDPCCDPGKQSPHDDQACAKACAAMCGVVSVLPASVVLTMTPGQAVFEIQIADEPRAHSPPSSERPPKPVA